MKKMHCFKVILLIFPVFIFAAGCGPIWYAMKTSNAKGHISAAKANGAGRGEEQYARYEITYAEEHYAKAQEEVSKADYQAAIELMKIAAQYGKKAKDIAVRLKMEAGRKKPVGSSE